MCIWGAVDKAMGVVVVAATICGAFVVAFNGFEEIFVVAVVDDEVVCLVVGGTEFCVL